MGIATASSKDHNRSITVEATPANAFTLVIIVAVVTHEPDRNKEAEHVPPPRGRVGGWGMGGQFSTRP